MGLPPFVAHVKGRPSCSRIAAIRRISGSGAPSTNSTSNMISPMQDENLIFEEHLPSDFGLIWGGAARNRRGKLPGDAYSYGSVSMGFLRAAWRARKSC